MGWVTLDDGQHVLIAGGQVYATRGQISSASGGKERGRALAARSKAAVGRAVGKSKSPAIRPLLTTQSPATARAIEHARAAGPSLREQADKARANTTARAKATGDSIAERLTKAKILTALHKGSGKNFDAAVKRLGYIPNKYPGPGVKAGEGYAVRTEHGGFGRWETIPKSQLQIHAIKRARRISLTV